MIAKDYYEQHTHEIVQQLDGFTPHELAQGAVDSEMDIYSYVLMLLDIDYEGTS